VYIVDERALGAAALLAALDEAGRSFREFGYRLFLTHQSVRWASVGRVGHAVAPCASVGVGFLIDNADREVSLGLDVWVRDNGFEVTGDATVDDPLPTPSGGGNQRSLRNLRAVVTRDLDECIAVLTRYTAELCAYTSVLDDLRVPRTEDSVGPGP
jgi:hypothetical protein